MADRRMIHRKIIESSAFYNLPSSAQCVYLHLLMSADDDGFVNNVGPVIAQVRNGTKGLRMLANSRFVLRIGDIYIIKHWRMANSLKNDRLKPPAYPDIAARIWIKPNRSYTDHPVPGCKTLLEEKTGIKMESKWNPSGTLIEKNRIELNRKETNRSADAAVKALFELLWNQYPEPRRGDKDNVFEAFRQHIDSDEAFEQMQNNLQSWLYSEQWNKAGGQYVPYFYNWIVKGTWQTPAPAGRYTGCGYTSGSREPDQDEYNAVKNMFSPEEWAELHHGGAE